MALTDASHLSGIHTLTTLYRALLRGTTRAKSPEDELALANGPLPKGALGRRWHVVPIDVLNISATVADEVMMQQSLRIETSGAALCCDLTHQACLHQVSQIVIGCGPGRSRVHPVHGFEDLDSRRVPVLFHQERHDGVALWSAPQSAAFQ